MSELSHCVEMAMMCRQCALEDEERKDAWFALAEMWNQRAGAALGHPIKEGIVTSSSDVANTRKSPQANDIRWNTIVDA
jgi:hypothetical protein